MNQGRIWCVVHPTVGLPLFLGSVAGISFIVHACVMTQTTWFPNYWQGGAKRTDGAKTQQTSENVGPTRTAVAAPQGTPAFAITVAPVPAAPGKAETAFVVTVTPSPGAAQAASSQPPDTGGKSTLAFAKPPER